MFKIFFHRLFLKGYQNTPSDFLLQIKKKLIKTQKK